MLRKEGCAGPRIEWRAGAKRSPPTKSPPTKFFGTSHKSLQRLSPSKSYDLYPTRTCNVSPLKILKMLRGTQLRVFLLDVLISYDFLSCDCDELFPMQNLGVKP